MHFSTFWRKTDHFNRGKTEQIIISLLAFPQLIFCSVHVLKTEHSPPCFFAKIFQNTHPALSWQNISFMLICKYPSGAPDFFQVPCSVSLAPYKFRYPEGGNLYWLQKIMQVTPLTLRPTSLKANTANVPAAGLSIPPNSTKNAPAAVSVAPTRIPCITIWPSKRSNNYIETNKKPPESSRPRGFSLYLVFFKL